jgi:drug/metabolite transporter (DMT)-like permease
MEVWPINARLRDRKRRHVLQRCRARAVERRIDMATHHSLKTELPLLGLLALLWGSSYLFIKVAVTEIPPLTLIALRVMGAAAFLAVVMQARGERFPRDGRTWRMLLLQAFFNSIGAWTVLAWGQQFVDAGLASVLNSTSPLFVFLFTALVTHHETLDGQKLVGAVVGFFGVVLIVGVAALQGFGSRFAGQLACLLGAALYACAAINGTRFGRLSTVVTATGTMIWATVFLVPVAIVVEQPWTLTPSTRAIAATAILSVFCTAVALLIYFRLVRTIGSLGVASQSYLRAGIGVVLGMVLLGETISLPVAVGVLIAILGVALINWPTRRLREAARRPACPQGHLRP